MKSESTQVSCMGIYHLFQFTVHTVVPVVPVTTHQIDPICIWKPYNFSESMHGRVLPSSFIHSKVLQPPQTKLITWSFPYVQPGNIEENEAQMVCLSLCWIKSNLRQKHCVVWNIQKHSLESPVIQLQQLITQFTKEFNSKTDGKWRTSQYYEAKTYIVPWS